MNTSTIAYSAWLHVVVIHSAFWNIKCTVNTLQMLYQIWLNAVSVVTELWVSNEPGLIWVKILQRNSMMNVFSKVVVLVRTYKPCIKNDKLSDSLSLCFIITWKTTTKAVCVSANILIYIHFLFTFILNWGKERSSVLTSKNKAWLNGCNILRIQVQVICFWKDPDVHVMHDMEDKCSQWS